MIRAIQRILGLQINDEQVGLLAQKNPNILDKVRSFSELQDRLGIGDIKDDITLIDVLDHLKSEITQILTTSEQPLTSEKKVVTLQTSYMNKIWEAITAGESEETKDLVKAEGKDDATFTEYEEFFKTICEKKIVDIDTFELVMRNIVAMLPNTPNGLKAFRSAVPLAEKKLWTSQALGYPLADIYDEYNKKYESTKDLFYNLEVQMKDRLSKESKYKRLFPQAGISREEYDTLDRYVKNLQDAYKTGSDAAVSIAKSKLKDVKTEDFFVLRRSMVYNV